MVKAEVRLAAADERVAGGRQRVIIEGVRPEIDGGRFAIKRTMGEKVVVEADIFTDGHEVIAAVLLHRREEDEAWTESPMMPLGNDRWRGEFVVAELGGYRYTIQGWIDHFQTWARDLAKRIEAGQDVSVDLLIGAELVEQAGERAVGADRESLLRYATLLRSSTGADHALSSDLAELMGRYSGRRFATTYGKSLPVVVDRERARFSTWYELFPRSWSSEPGRHGTFRDVEAALPDLASMGFDVLYLPPIHPIGRSFRKGRNNNVVAEPDAVGSPWAIGSVEGGHTAIHPELGSLDDFRRLVRRVGELGIDLALDIAFQASPDHPYVTEHPEWFRSRPDGTIQYAENPPKKYQDIYPFDFETGNWRELWAELRDVVRFWAGHGVRVFRVDNPHTKPFRFWEWLIAEVKRDYPEAIFLAEAFTRPKVMYYLAKLGFTQSYTYFAWRNTRWELTEYFTELTQSDVREFFRPNLWTNTPDILTEYLQSGGRPAFAARLILAATLGASYGMYGPVFELIEHQSVAPGSEEYLNSEKYEIRHWDRERPDSLRELIARVNAIRRANRALQGDWSLRFHQVDNQQIIAYTKATDDLSNVILTVVNLDPHNTQSGWVELPLEELDIDPEQPYQVHDLLTGAHYTWNGRWNYVELNPHAIPAHILQVRRRMRREQDFEYFI
ncbi:alpha-1,4-glucan--maltose-1-phosphate maltosyltransferase [Nitrolancea hollandica]|uniref:Alpha-1,4-glucan:maltose-1-phosphate maltosyltransferase n=1 Tax=Nitrolancea hollandica Lb TaxID=1129897 RepID=I4ELX0_9BACT|nr:alpha-1,4-glucan--maltose-1-phosphate maltosyltransferase [Nitrolancea hollandica]CCF85683.1 Glycoside hydrolase, putative alpha-amylase [Nitrolancea hollandica Lb]